MPLAVTPCHTCHPLSFVSECAKLLCFRYYSGLNLSCLAQSEPLSLPSQQEPSHLQLCPIEQQVQPQVQAQRLRGRAAKSCHRPGSSDSDSDAESSSKQRKQKSWRLHKKKTGHPKDSKETTKKIVNGFAELDVNKDHW